MYKPFSFFDPVFIQNAGTTFDPDAIAFLAAAAITDASIANAINDLVISFKQQDLWNKMFVIYPFVGSTETTHKFNLKNPVNSNAAFRLEFEGPWSHNANGPLANGINTFANTYFNPSLDLPNVSNNHVAIDSGTNNANTRPDVIDIGAFTGVSSRLWLSTGNNNNVTPATANYGSRIAGNAATKVGLYVSSRLGSNTVLYKNASVLASTVIDSGNPPNLHMYLGNLNFSGNAYSDGWGKQRYRFCSIGDTLTATNVINLTNIVQTFQTQLNR